MKSITDSQMSRPAQNQT